MKGFITYKMCCLMSVISVSLNLFNRQLAQFGAHVVMAVRKPKAAHDLIQKWQDEMSGSGILLNIEVLRDLGVNFNFT